MRSLEIKRQMDAAALDEVSELLNDAWRADGARPLNDHLWLDLREGGRTGFAGIIARQDDHSHAIGYCQVSRGNESWSLDLVIHPHHRYDFNEIAPDLVRAAIGVVASEGGGHLHWWIFEPNNTHRQLAESSGLHQGRRLLQMRRSLPLERELAAPASGLEVSAFDPATDTDRWLEINNAAFAAHPEQGGWTRDTLQARMREPWFDPEGFLIHRTGGVVDGFCWTKIHGEGPSRCGEIYVVAVHPSAAGHGLGHALTVAGLESIAARGVDQAMLFVDADNAPAVAVYRRLGFTVHHEEHAFVGDIGARP